MLLEDKPKLLVDVDVRLTASFNASMPRTDCTLLSAYFDFVIVCLATIPCGASCILEKTKMSVYTGWK